MKKKRGFYDETTPCTWCGQPMDRPADAVDWRAAWVRAEIKKREAALCRALSNVERACAEADVGGYAEPCSLCCCALCGYRRLRPGAPCC